MLLSSSAPRDCWPLRWHYLKAETWQHNNSSMHQCQHESREERIRWSISGCVTPTQNCSQWVLSIIIMELCIYVYALSKHNLHNLQAASVSSYDASWSPGREQSEVCVGNLRGSSCFTVAVASLPLRNSVISAFRQSFSANLSVTFWPQWKMTFQP